MYAVVGRVERLVVAQFQAEVERLGSAVASGSGKTSSSAVSRVAGRIMRRRRGNEETKICSS